MRELAVYKIRIALTNIFLEREKKVINTSLAFLNASN